MSEHVHDENCTCGCHDEHHHDHASEGCHGCSVEVKKNIPFVSVKEQDGAQVVSGMLAVSGSYPALRRELERALALFAEDIADADGIIGHIKCAAEVKNVDMFSVTEDVVDIKTALEQDIKITLAAIVFGVDADEAKTMAKRLLESVV